MAEKMARPVIVVHGGADFTVQIDNKQAIVDGLCKAARRGYEILQSEDSNAVRAVVEAVSVLEDDENFNAGRGSTLNRDGKIQTDAMVMNGKNLKCGGVSAVMNIANPVYLAEQVMEKTNHCLLTAQYANDFAKKVGMETVDMETLMSPRSRRLLESISIAREEGRVNDAKKETVLGKDTGKDTVGAIALDKNGNLACATSTGGLSLALPGRVGDSALPGCGGYADNHFGACSTTGIGEDIMRVNMATRAMYYLEQGQSAQDAAVNSVQYLVDRLKPSDSKGCLAGLIVIDKQGNIGIHCSHDFLCFASIKNGKIQYGINPDEFESTGL
ncbi:isoaspartyl peptidase/L-asparaginase-like [Ptychodera flava]|uniref:isoaspartyl peptidase/L-asparaginase-like n=1 Tax=Ptychodera flava TaxID=63121 RepID=UPI00396A49D8